MDNILIVILSLICIFGFIFIFVFLREILKIINKRCNDLREFININSGIFTVLFILIFFLQQTVLIFSVYYFFKISATAQFLISFFALTVLTTAALEKFILEKKYQYQRREIDNFSYENEKILINLKDLSKNYKELYDKYKGLKEVYNKLKSKK